MKQLKRLLTTVLLLSQGAVIIAATNASLWDGTESAFAVIDAANQEFLASKDAFTQLSASYTTLRTNFDANEVQRQSAFVQIQSNVAALAASLTDAQAAQITAAQTAAAEQATLTSDISSTTAQRQAIIDGLNINKTALQAEIAQLQQDLATLAELNETRVAELQTDLATTMASYDAMVVERQAFLDVLDQTLLRAQAYEFTTESDLAALAPAETGSN